MSTYLLDFMILFRILDIPFYVSTRPNWNLHDTRVRFHRTTVLLWRVIHGNQQTQFFDETVTLERYIPASRSLSVIQLQHLNVKFQRLDSEYFSRSLSNLSQIARMTLARSTRLSFVRPYHDWRDFSISLIISQNVLSVNLSIYGYYTSINTTTAIVTVLRTDSYN